MNNKFFKDYFSAHAQNYANFRPQYPESLFSTINEFCACRDLAWDCATGSGQAAIGLASYFERIVATDASKNQISEAIDHAKISFKTEKAEETSFLSQSIDLIIVAQALHWFDFEKFFKEVKRVLKSDGVFAVWCYGLHSVSEQVDQILLDYYQNKVGSFWPPERKHVEQQYNSIDIPFKEVFAKEIVMSAQWNLNQMLRYLGTWSATQKYISEMKNNPLDEYSHKFNEVWGNSDRLTMKWPITLKVYRMN